MPRRNATGNYAGEDCIVEYKTSLFYVSMMHIQVYTKGYTIGCESRFFFKK